MTVLLNGRNTFRVLFGSSGVSRIRVEVRDDQQSHPFLPFNKYIVHRLVELAEFYQLGGYQHWSRMQQTDIFADSDSSDSSDGSSIISREEAVRRFPDTARQALAATLGLVYYKIRNEVGEGRADLVSPTLSWNG